jgi:hypothetical protein
MRLVVMQHASTLVSTQPSYRGLSAVSRRGFLSVDLLLDTAHKARYDGCVDTYGASSWHDTGVGFTKYLHHAYE